MAESDLYRKPPKKVLCMRGENVPKCRPTRRLIAITSFPKLFYRKSQSLNKVVHPFFLIGSKKLAITNDISTHTQESRGAFQNQ